MLDFQNPTLDRYNKGRANDVAKLQYVNDELQITLYGSCELNLSSGEITYNNEIDLSTLNINDNDLLIVRYRFYNDELNDISASSLTIKTDAHSIVTLNITRDNEPILTNYVINKSTTYTRNDLLSIDEYSYTITPDFGYVLDNMPSSGSGDLRYPLSLEVKTIPDVETTLTIEMSKRMTCVVAFTINGVTSYEPVFNGRKIYHIPYGTVVGYYFNNTTNMYNYNTQRATHDYNANSNSWVERSLTVPITSNICYAFSTINGSITMTGDQTIVLRDIGVRRSMVIFYQLLDAYNVPSSNFFVYRNSDIDGTDYYPAPRSARQQTEQYQVSQFATTPRIGDIGFLVGAQVPNMSGMLCVGSRTSFPADSTQGLSNYVKETDTYLEFDYSDLIEGNKISVTNINERDLYRVFFIIPND